MNIHFTLYLIINNLFLGFLGMGKKKEEPDDKKKLLEIESMSSNSQEGIELRQAAELMEKETKQGMNTAFYQHFGSDVTPASFAFY